MRTRLVRAAVAAILAGSVAALLAPAALAKEDKNVCTGPVPPGVTFNGGLLVPSGASCMLNSDTVNGGMDVQGGRIDIESSVLHGGLHIDNLAPGNSTVCASLIQGGTTAENIDSMAILSYGESNTFFGHPCPGNRIDGDTDIVNNPAASNIELDHNLIHGAFEWLNSMVVYGEFEGNRVTGKATCQTAPPVINDGDGGSNSYTGPDNGCPA